MNLRILVLASMLATTTALAGNEGGKGGEKFRAVYRNGLATALESLELVPTLTEAPGLDGSAAEKTYAAQREALRTTLKGLINDPDSIQIVTEGFDEDADGSPDMARATTKASNRRIQLSEPYLKSFGLTDDDSCRSALHEALHYLVETGSSVPHGVFDQIGLYACRLAQKVRKPLNYSCEATRNADGDVTIKESAMLYALRSPGAVSQTEFKRAGVILTLNSRGIDAIIKNPSDGTWIGHAGGTWELDSEVSLNFVSFTSPGSPDVNVRCVPAK